MKDTLPNKPSALIRLALADIKKVEADPDYKVDMGTWMFTRPGAVDADVCEVCFAGAVLAKRLNVPPPEASKQISLDEAVGEGTLDDKLSMLDCFRSGDIVEGLMQHPGLGVIAVDTTSRLRIYERELGHLEYSDAPARWKQIMRELATRLEAYNL